MLRSARRTRDDVVAAAVPIAERSAERDCVDLAETYALLTSFAARSRADAALNETALRLFASSLSGGIMRTHAECWPRPFTRRTRRRPRLDKRDGPELERAGRVAQPGRDRIAPGPGRRRRRQRRTGAPVERLRAARALADGRVAIPHHVRRAPRRNRSGEPGARLGHRTRRDLEAHDRAGLHALSARDRRQQPGPAEPDHASVSPAGLLRAAADLSDRRTRSG